MGIETSDPGNREKFIGHDGREYQLSGQFEAEVVEDMVEFRGVKYKKTLIPNHDLRSYYSHEGPGWDSRMILLDNNYAMAMYGRTFTDSEISNTDTLPEIPCYKLEVIE
jgi:hypothetical protein